MKEATMPEFTPQQKQRAIRETREHYLAHKVQGCVQCDLWQAYMSGDEVALEAVLKRADVDEEFQAIAEMLRTDWGEGTWTDRESE
jgi:hypothetical protein